MFYNIFWFYPVHHAINLVLDKTRFVFWYLGLWHSWNMFSTPYHENKIVSVKVIYDDGETLCQKIYDPDYGIFFNRKATPYEIRFFDYFCYTNHDEFKKIIGDYAIKIFSKKDKKITQIEFIVGSVTIAKKGYEYLYSTDQRDEVSYVHKAIV